MKRCAGEDYLRTTSAVRMIRLIPLVLMSFLPNPARADCTIDPSRMKPRLSPEALQVRDALHLRLCMQNGGSLVDITDPTLTGRVERPSGLQLPKNGDIYPPEARRARWEGTVILGFLIGIDGAVSSTRRQTGSRPRLLKSSI